MELVEESLRILGLLPTVAGREDWLLGVEGVWTQRLLLYQLFQQALGASTQVFSFLDLEEEIMISVSCSS